MQQGAIPVKNGDRGKNNKRFDDKIACPRRIKSFRAIDVYMRQAVYICPNVVPNINITLMVSILAHI